MYTLSLHDALPILQQGDVLRRRLRPERRREAPPDCEYEQQSAAPHASALRDEGVDLGHRVARVHLDDIAGGLVALALDTNRMPARDRKSTRLNSSHGYISYAVFCLKKKNMITIT